MLVLKPPSLVITVGCQEPLLMVSHLTDSETCAVEEAQGQGRGENEVLFWEAREREGKKIAIDTQLGLSAFQ